MSGRRASQRSKLRRSLGDAGRAVAGLFEVIDDHVLVLDGLVVPVVFVIQVTNPLLRHLLVKHLTSSPLWVEVLFVFLLVGEVSAQIHRVLVVLIVVVLILVVLIFVHALDVPLLPVHRLVPLLLVGGLFLVQPPKEFIEAPHVGHDACTWVDSEQRTWRCVERESQMMDEVQKSVSRRRMENENGKLGWRKTRECALIHFSDGRHDDIYPTEYRQEEACGRVRLSKLQANITA
ncbi:hypothetical protein BGZ61DRAFT_445967 [Ilyonectria robusta]|uniref:uncharacterized protein n=1 Tax=Ilyonectria robusta TaxID=1079257 RepID=UPI001E8E41ED|nr:uncharacterized protein BGZ61DRAFT_445967 [Ilyonectria robusta]KAH8729198.1 hypothetical protein BGZ61DRAFT_445967 [Ilyonectria robusta]